MARNNIESTYIFKVVSSVLDCTLDAINLKTFTAWLRFAIEFSKAYVHTFIGAKIKKKPQDMSGACPVMELSCVHARVWLGVCTRN